MRRLALTYCFVVLSAGGCATQVIESKVSTTVTDTVTGDDTNLAGDDSDLSGADLDELVTVLQVEMSALSRAVLDSDEAAARAHLDRINQAWVYAEPLIVAKFGELADQITYDLRRVVELARSAVERNRPADADKAVAFLRLAIASLNL
ncbi:MAG: hypothetical protein FJW93_01135 [Actinobacteria bacterium]|nr:hypothetical protein [Actinomycetota bacterium]MBM3815592.1 hypothetical protein [Actinomycetota bacterium]